MLDKKGTILIKMSSIYGSMSLSYWCQLITTDAAARDEGIAAGYFRGVMAISLYK
jgi:hypothetical protein